MSPDPVPAADTVRLQKQVATLKRKVAKVEAERDWAVSERDITNRWAEQAWEQVRHLRALLEKAIAANEGTIVIPSPGPASLPPPTWQNPVINEMTTHPSGRIRLQQFDGRDDA